MNAFISHVCPFFVKLSWIRPCLAGAARMSPAGRRARRHGAEGSPSGATGSPRGGQGSPSGARGSPSGAQGPPSGAQGSPSGATRSSRGARGSPSGAQGSLSGSQGSPRAGPWDHEAWPRAHPFVGRGGIAIPSRPVPSGRVRPERTSLLPLLSPAGGLSGNRGVLSRFWHLTFYIAAVCYSIVRPLRPSEKG